MRALYHLRVVLVSFEAATLVSAAAIWSMFPGELAVAARSASATSDVLTFLLLLPLALIPWLATEARNLLHEDKETTRLLAKWPDYWRLKCHVFASLAYALLFAALSIVPWFLPSGIATPSGFLLFCTSVMGQLMVAASVYVARLKVKEVVALAGAA